jgi:hypothetical protein
MRPVLLVALMLSIIALPAVAKSHRTIACAFPDGWNPADHQRQMAGEAPDAHHMCEMDAGGHPIDSHGRPTR